MSELRCYGCGNVLQCENETEAGYVPSKILETRENILCQRCFKLQHYNTNSEVQLVAEDFVNILKNVGKHDALVVYVIDLFAFESSIIENLSTYLNNKPILILANKRDLIPSSVKDNKLKDWIKSRLNTLGIFAMKEKKILSQEIEQLERNLNDLKSKKSSAEIVLEVSRKKLGALK